MNFSWILLTVVSLAFTHAVVASPVDPLTQASDELLVIRNKRCDINGRNCGFPGLIGNQANGGGGDNNGTGGDGGNIGNDGLQIDTTNSKDRKARATPVASPLTRTKRCDDAGTPCGLPDLFANQANGGDGDHGGLGGNGGNVGNLVRQPAGVVVATPVASPLTRTKRCDIYGRNCVFPGLVGNQANGGGGDHGGLGGHGGNVGNKGLSIASTESNM